MQNQSYHTQPQKSNNKCPTCGWKIGQAHTFENMLLGQFSNEKNGDFTAIRSTPFRAFSLEADVIVPLAQSLVSGIETVLVMIPVSMWLDFKWPVVMFSAAATMALTWIAAIRKAEFTTLKTEEFSYSAAQSESGGVHVKRADGPLKMEIIHETSGIRNRMQIMDLPAQITEDEFGAFLRDVLAGKSLARSNWVGSDRPFSRDTFDQMIEKLLSVSLIQPASNGGKQLSNGGRHAIRRMVREGII